MLSKLCMAPGVGRQGAYAPQHRRPPRWCRAICLVALCGAAGAWGLSGCGAAIVEAAGTEELPVNAQPKALFRPQNLNPRPWHNKNYDPNVWASGGTAQLRARSQPEEPFGSSNGTKCRVTCSLGAPLCAVPHELLPVGRDLAQGHDGLPMRLVLRIVGPDCQPIPQAVVTVWHASPEGAYSGTAAPDCAAADPNAAHSLAFRGSQVADTSGTAVFDSCFPGALVGRGARINVQVRRHGELYLQTEFLFDEGLVADIQEWHPHYRAPRGFAPGLEFAPLLRPDALDQARLDVAQLADGTMLAYKILVLRNSLDEPSCSLTLEQPLAPLILKPTQQG